MTRTVADAAAELGAIAGKDPEDPATATAPDTVPNYLAGLSPTALQGKRIGVINNTNAQYVAAIAAIQALGATTVRSRRRPRRSSSSILFPEFKRDLNAYLARLPAERADEDARRHHRLQQRERRTTRSSTARARSRRAQATDLTNPAELAAYVTTRDNGRRNAQQAIDNALTRGTADPADDLEAIMTPGTTLTGTRRAAGYPQLVVPAGYDAGEPRPGRDRVQRHGLQRGEAARVRLRLRAGGEDAQAAERDQPEPVALRPRQRVHGHDARLRAERDRERGRDRGHGQRHRAGDAVAVARHAGDASGRSRRASSGTTWRARPRT